MASFITLSSQLNPGAATSTNLAAIALADTLNKPIVSQVQSLEEIIKDKAKENGVDPVLAEKIVSCESQGRQFDKAGDPLRGEVNPADVGLFQINEKYHLKRSQDLGFDIHTTEGNIDYAIWLLKHDGSQHWSASKPCWSKS